MGIFKSFQWKHYFISTIIVSVLAFLVHAKDYQPIEIDRFFMWLPAVWLLVFVMGFSFTLFIGGDN